MVIWVDADGCPVVNIAVSCAKIFKREIVIVKNHAIEIEDDYAQIITVDVSRDAADYYIVNHIQAGDLVITQDYGLAAMVLAKKGEVLNQNGRWINNSNIDLILDQRHVSRVSRMQKKGYTKFKKRTKEEDECFKDALLKCLQSVSIIKEL